MDADHSQSVARNRIEADRTFAGTLSRAGVWEILCSWGDGGETSLLLAHFSGVKKTREPGEYERSIRELSCRSELILCAEEDLKTFARSTPATRAKAIEWLRGRGESVASSGLRASSGQITTQENILEWIHNKNGWDTATLGLVVELECQVGPHGKLVDLQMDATWTPRDAVRPPASPRGEFRLADCASSGTTLVVEPKVRPDDGPVPVLFVTPVVHTVLEANPKPLGGSSAGRGEGIRTYQHFVHPSFRRKLAELNQVNVHDGPPPQPQKLLESLGMTFPDGTRFFFTSGDCRVMLTHTAEGNALFLQLLKEYGLAAPEG